MLARPPFDGCDVKTDVLSDVLRAVHLTGAVYFDFELSSPWVVEAPASRDIVGKVMPGAQHDHRVPSDRARELLGTCSGRRTDPIGRG